MRCREARCSSLLASALHTLHAAADLELCEDVDVELVLDRAAQHLLQLIGTGCRQGVSSARSDETVQCAFVCRLPVLLDAGHLQVHQSATCRGHCPMGCTLPNLLSMERSPSMCAASEESASSAASASHLQPRARCRGAHPATDTGDAPWGL